VSYRNHNQPDNFNNENGFRVVVAPDIQLNSAGKAVASRSAAGQNEKMTARSGPGRVRFMNRPAIYSNRPGLCSSSGAPRKQVAGVTLRPGLIKKPCRIFMDFKKMTSVRLVILNERSE